MSDSKGRPTAADIPDQVALEAALHIHSGHPGNIVDLLRDRWPEKVIYSKLDKLDRRGLIECGVSLRTAWLTDKGRAFLTNAPVPATTTWPRDSEGREVPA